MTSKWMGILIVVAALSGCAADKSQQLANQQCLDAKRQLEKAIEAGEQDDLKNMKRNIELYCVWRK